MTDKRTKKLEAHSIADIWPVLSDEELQSLADDIEQNGLVHPVVLYEGKILDGRNRARACEMAGVAIKTTKTNFRIDESVGEALLGAGEGGRPAPALDPQHPAHRRQTHAGQARLALILVAVLVLVTVAGCQPEIASSMYSAVIVTASPWSSRTV